MRVMLVRRPLVLAPLTFLVAVAFPLWTNGCSGGQSSSGGGDGGAEAGGDGSVLPIPTCSLANVGGTNRSKVAVQAINDYAASAASHRDALLVRCTAIAKALDAAPADQTAADAQTDPRAKVRAWCSLAVKAIGVTKAAVSGLITVDSAAPRCEDSVPEKGACQARCSASGTCDLLANPPKCTGGSLFVSCKGNCTATGGATLSCVGTCTAACRGSCTASAGVECAGTCSGTCSASGSGTGLQADGSCRGSCQGTCAATAPGVSCPGACDGECAGSCAGSAGAPVKCDGACSGAFDLLTCTGGKLEGGCAVDTKCDAYCDVTVAAKSVCPAKPVDVRVSGAANTAAAAKLRAALIADLGAVQSLRAHLEHLAALAGTVTSSADAISDIVPACIPPLVAAAGSSVDDVQGALSAASSIVTAVQ